MRTTANTNRLRATALLLLALGVCAPFLGVTLAVPLVLLLAGNVLGLLLLTIGLAFWSLSRDQNAGILVDGKGLLLNLGGSSSFIAWDTIERAGTTTCFTSVLTIGSRRQLGITLRDSRSYIQSYEERLPSAPGPIQHGLRLVQRALRARHPLADEELALHLAACRRRTGYDILIPEALLGQPAAPFAALVEERRQSTTHRIPSLQWRVL